MSTLLWISLEARRPLFDGQREYSPETYMECAPLLQDERRCVELEARSAEVRDWVGERKVGKEMKRIGDMQGGGYDWVIAR
jgi:hypothetical protein